MQRSLSFFSVLVLWALPAAGQEALLGTWKAIDEGVEFGFVEEDGTLHREMI